MAELFVYLSPAITDWPTLFTSLILDSDRNKKYDSFLTNKDYEIAIFDTSHFEQLQKQIS